MSLDLEAIKDQLAGITPSPWEAVSVFIMNDHGGGDWGTDADEAFINCAPQLVADLVDEIQRLESELSLIKTAAGWRVYFEQHAKPLRDEIARLTELVERKD